MNMFTYPLGILLFIVGFIIAAISLAIRAKKRPFSSEATLFSLAFIVLMVELFGYALLILLTHHVAEGGLLSDEKWLLFDLILFFVLGVILVFIVGIIAENFVPAIRKYLSAKQVNNISIAILLIFVGIHWYKNKIPKLDFTDTAYVKIEGFKPSNYNLHAELNFQSDDRSCYFKPSNNYTVVAKGSGSRYNIELPLSLKQGDCDFYLLTFSVSLHLKNSLFFIQTLDFNALLDNWFSSQKVALASNVYIRTIGLLRSTEYEADDYDEANIYCQRYLLGIDPSRSDAICRSVRKRFSRDISFSKQFIAKRPITLNILLSEDFKREASGRYVEVDNEETVEQNKTKRTIPVIQFNIEQNTSTLPLSIYDRTERMITGSDTEPTIHIIHTDFIPSIELFTAYKNSQKEKVK